MQLKSLAKLAVIALAISGAAGATTLTFSEFALQTVITNQYAAQGVTFAGVNGGSAPIISADGAMPNSPVLSPNPPYAGEFMINFTGGASGVQFDSGYWNGIGDGSIEVFDTSNTLVATLSDTTLGVDHINLSSYGTIGSILFDSRNDSGGADIDNLQFNTTPEPTTLLSLGLGLGVVGLLRRKLVR